MAEVFDSVCEQGAFVQRAKRDYHALCAGLYYAPIPAGNMSAQGVGTVGTC